MAKKNSFAKQFRGGYYPQEPADESTRVNGREPSSVASHVRGRQGLSPGSQTEASPGMVGKQSYGKKRGK